jgi:dihydropteroate synthase
MEYHEAASFLFDLRRYPPRAGLDATRTLLAHLNDPHGEYAVIQVAGSNGKGSTARMVERVLREAGLDVGLFTSPHLSDLRERVRVNGRKVRKRAVAEFVEDVRGHVLDAAAAGDAPTFFETITGLALAEFARRDCDVAVLEVGIGGRYDATSVTDPVASAVTNVTLEHTDVLGDTIDEIARDMAHVAGEYPLVTAATGEALAAVREVAGDVVTVGNEDGGASEGDGDGRAPAIRARYGGRDGLEGTVSIGGEGWSVDVLLPQLGAHQATNAGVAVALARQAGDALGVTVDGDVLARGLSRAHWPGRFEVVDRTPLSVLDGAHNPGGVETVAATLAEFDYGDLYLVFGAMSDKDHAGMIEALPRIARAWACEPTIDRSEDRDVLAQVLDRRAGYVRTAETVPDAVDAALSAAGPDDCVLVTGSLYAVAEARERWTRVAVPKRIRSTAEAEAALADADVAPGEIERLHTAGVHRVLRTRLLPERARRLREELLAAGGNCALSNVEGGEHEYVECVATGTVSQLRQCCDALERRAGVADLAETLRGTLRGDRYRYGYPWEEGTAVMGILNVTPDSFHDGGEYNAVEDAVARAQEMIDAGVDVLDVGGESTRPGAEPVAPEEELARIEPVLDRLDGMDALVSVDTRKAEVAREALDAGADILNDVSGLEDPEIRRVAAGADCPAVVMHSIEVPVDPDSRVRYDDVVEDVIDVLRERMLLAEKAGIDRSKVIVDPGLGFGKSHRENFELLGRLDEFHALGCPVLVGHSHKSMFDLVGYDADERLPATIAGTAVAAERGADIVRVHDVPENVAAVRTWLAADDPDTIPDEGF